MLDARDYIIFINSDSHMDVILAAVLIALELVVIRAWEKKKNS